MFAHLVSLPVLLLIAILGGQVPTTNGIIGGASGFKPNARSGPALTTEVTGSLRVTENSGICETTEGVYQASGYGDLDSSSHIWFWFFEARNSPDNAPLTVWLNGGPGASSMVGLFQEHGPCRIKNDSSGVDLNPTSRNEVANMLYIDQPVGVGFSYGDATIGTSEDAAKDMWKFLQIFFADPRFSKYASHEFALWTESYGGHYGPIFASYFLDQNAAISAGTIQGIPINLKVLGIGNGWTDPLSQYPGYISYSKSNPYHQLVNDSMISSVNESYYSSGGCRDQIVACNENLDDSVCSTAKGACENSIAIPLLGIYDLYYVPATYPNPYPPDFTDYINADNVRSAIGAETNWTVVSVDVSKNFSSTGDDIKSSASYLEKVINAGIRTSLYDGDADYICNYIGFEAMIANLNTSVSARYAAQPWTQWTIDGITVGKYKNAGALSYVRIYQAGHEVSAYTVGNLPIGLHALRMFTQANALQPISSTERECSIP